MLKKEGEIEKLWVGVCRLAMGRSKFNFSLDRAIVVWQSSLW